MQTNSPLESNLGMGGTGNQPVPNATAVLVLGILSIVFCWCYGIIGAALSIIALVLASNAQKAYNANPSAYSPGSYGNLKGGRVCAIIGLILSCLYLLLIIIYIAVVGSLISAMPWDELFNR
jgi:cobalamin synthase